MTERSSQSTKSRWHDPIRVKGTPERRAYLAACKHQLSMWLTGVSLHNKVNGDCCPDFSCCHPDMRMPMDERAAYYREHVAELEAERA